MPAAPGGGVGGGQLPPSYASHRSAAKPTTRPNCIIIHRQCPVLATQPPQPQSSAASDPLHPPGVGVATQTHQSPVYRLHLY